MRRASLAGIDLNTRDGQLFARLPEAMQPDLIAAIQAHKSAIVATLVKWPVPDDVVSVFANDRRGRQLLDSWRTGQRASGWREVNPAWHGGMTDEEFYAWELNRLANRARGGDDSGLSGH